MFDRMENVDNQTRQAEAIAVSRVAALMKAVLTQPSGRRFTRERKSGPAVKVVTDEITIA